MSSPWDGSVVQLALDERGATYADLLDLIGAQDAGFRSHHIVELVL